MPIFVQKCWISGGLFKIFKENHKKSVAKQHYQTSIKQIILCFSAGLPIYCDESTLERCPFSCRTEGSANSVSVLFEIESSAIRAACRCLKLPHWACVIPSEKMQWFSTQASNQISPFRICGYIGELISLQTDACPIWISAIMLIHAAAVEDNIDGSDAKWVDVSAHTGSHTYVPLRFRYMYIR